MAEARHFCPDCGSIDLRVTNSGLTGPDGESLARGSCPNCSWEGPLSKTIGAVTQEQFWDSDRVGDVLLRVMAKNAAGPLVQVLEFIGLLPRMRFKPRDLPEGTITQSMFDDYHALKKEWEIYNQHTEEEHAKWNAAVQVTRNNVMRRIMADALSGAFEEAERQNRIFAVAMGTQIHPMLEQESAREFGGNVTNIKKARAKKKRKK
jgi:hypothetical protein